MRMSQGVEWALHCCHLLTGLPADASASSSQLAEFYQLPAAYLSKHLQTLARAGVMAALPGPQGGYRLARPADQISVLDVVMAIEGTATLFRCTEIRQRVPVPGPPETYRNPCAIASVFARADEAWSRELSNVTIADLADTASRNSAAAQKGAQSWLAAVTRSGSSKPSPAKSPRSTPKHTSKREGQGSDKS